MAELHTGTASGTASGAAVGAAVGAGFNALAPHPARHLARPKQHAFSDSLSIRSVVEAPRPVVLYVEDHPVNAMLMQAVFARMPHIRLVLATSGQDALDKVAELQPALLLLDLHLPDCHGTQLLARLRKLAQTAQVRAVAVTADSLFDCSTSDFDELWTKPLDLTLVMNRVNSLVSATANPGTPLAQLPMRRPCDLRKSETHDEHSQFTSNGDH